MRRVLSTSALGLALAAAAGCAPAGPGAGDADELTRRAISGLEFFSQKGCAACHCNDGVGGCNLDAPSLQSMDRGRLEAALRADQNVRPHPLKITSMPDEAIDDLMVFFNSLEPGAPLQGNSQITIGYNLYVQGGCIACHLASAQGVNQGGTGLPIAGTNPDNIYAVLSGQVPCHPRQRAIPDETPPDCRFGIQTNDTVQRLTDTPPPDTDNERVMLSYFLAFISPIPSSGVVEPCDKVSGQICTVAGNGVSGFTRDGVTATRSLLYSPIEVALTDWNADGVLDLVVVDWNNHRVRIVYIDTVIDGVADRIDSIAGTGKVTGTDALNHPTDAAFDAQGALVMANWHNQNIYRYPRGLSSGADRHQLAGLCDLGCADDRNGPTLVDQTLISLPSSVVLHPDGRVFFAESGCSRIRVLTPGPGAVRQQPAQCITEVNLYAGGTIQTLAGTAGMNGYGGDGGPASQAIFNADNTPLHPNLGIAFSPENPPRRLYVADSLNHCIRVISMDTDPPAIDLFAGVPGEPGFRDGPAATAQFQFPANVYVHSDGHVYVSDTRNHAIRRIDPDGQQVETIAGNGVRGFNGDNIPATEAHLGNPGGVAVHPDGRIFVADLDNNRVRVVYP